MIILYFTITTWVDYSCKCLCEPASKFEHSSLHLQFSASSFANCHLFSYLSPSGATVTNSHEWPWKEQVVGKEKESEEEDIKDKEVKQMG